MYIPFGMDADDKYIYWVSSLMWSYMICNNMCLLNWNAPKCDQNVIITYHIFHKICLIKSKIIKRQADGPTDSLNHMVFDHDVSGKALIVE